MPANTILPEKTKESYKKEIAFLRNCAKMGNIKISRHCYKMISNRNIKLADVYETIKSGTIMEIQTLERDTKILFQDSVNHPPTFFVAVAIKPSMGVCVTAYLPDTEKWFLDSNAQWRRK